MSLSTWDYTLFQNINQLAGMGTFLNPVMRFLAQDAEYLFYLGILFYWFTRSRSNRKMSILALVSACVGLGVSGIIGQVFYRDRPFVTHEVYQLIGHAANASFPSDHATGAFVIAASIWLYRKKEGTVWLLLALGVAFSRVWTGVHYPGDVLAGALLGTVSATAVYLSVKHWAFADKWLEAGIRLYEKLEERVWPKKTQPQPPTI
ncbi:undecaprenyl-diphosphatase [Paenibacillus chitinolyticus]|uniref:undecaprenyl-diphosphatase n=1 Tax=Paenibacillus chitinolyticus TaxID=79263 RepID=UPI002DBB3AB4|nr:undecaprenyl-diphosphatase [Paenibacillus chitinolyticus]MEC0248925.1 undecaprenyl-diphosphatase [Paenibacillus chitinolyticus]